MPPRLLASTPSLPRALRRLASSLTDLVSADLPLALPQLGHLPVQLLRPQIHDLAHQHRSLSCPNGPSVGAPLMRSSLDSARARCTAATLSSASRCPGEMSREMAMVSMPEFDRRAWISRLARHSLYEAQDLHNQLRAVR